MENLTDEQIAKNKLKEIYEDGFAEINGREYKFTVMTHSQRRSVFAFYSTVQKELANQDFGFLDSADFAKVEKIILDRVTVDGMQVSKLPGHFEDYPEDYLILICSALGVISYPFFRGKNTS